VSGLKLLAMFVVDEVTAEAIRRAWHAYSDGWQPGIPMDPSR